MTRGFIIKRTQGPRYLKLVESEIAFWIRDPSKATCFDRQWGGVDRLVEAVSSVFNDEMTKEDWNANP